jgi:hypothetical protein
MNLFLSARARGADSGGGEGHHHGQAAMAAQIVVGAGQLVLLHIETGRHRRIVGHVVGHCWNLLERASLICDSSNILQYVNIVNTLQRYLEMPYVSHKTKTILHIFMKLVDKSLKYVLCVVRYIGYF